MDELRGPTIQIILHVKEGLGFGFMKSPFIASGSLNGYVLDTDPVIPCHAPTFDAQLVWEADKRRFRSLRVQNVPIKVEVYSMGTQGRKDKVGYLLLSLLGAQPCPSNKFTEVKHTWHKLLGVRAEGKCCHPQLLLSLTIEDRANTLTPRNELRLFHSNEIAYPSVFSGTNPPSAKSVLFTLNEYIAESKKTVSSPDLQPQLLCDEGLIQIGDGRHLFVINLVIGAVENLHLLLPDQTRDAVDCCVTYSLFTHNIMTDRVSSSSSQSVTSAHFNQRTSLRVRSDLPTLVRYFNECPYLVTKICAVDKDVGICSLDLRKLIPTDDINLFVTDFCNEDKALTIHERCFILRCDGAMSDGNKRPYVDVEYTLKYAGIKSKKPSTDLTARSVSNLESDRKEILEKDSNIEYRSGSCTHLDHEIGGVAYTNMSARNTARYKTASGDAVIQTNEIAELIKKMCESFASTQERLLASHTRPPTSDEQVQVKYEDNGNKGDEHITKNTENEVITKTHIGVNTDTVESEPVKLDKPSKNDTYFVDNEKEKVNQVISANEKEAIMQRIVDELEDWKEKQQELYKCQLKRKEEYHLELLAKEWAKKRCELECKLNKGIEQCRQLAADLSRATEDFRLRGYRNSEREKKLLEAKKQLEEHYTAKYQELREASQKMEDDMNHQLRVKDMRIEELELKVMQLEKRVDTLKESLTNIEKESESRHSGLTKDQTASLIQELRCLEEKLDSAVQSKAFFKEQWGRAVRELHLMKLSTRRQMLTQLQNDRRQLQDMGLDPIKGSEDNLTGHSEADLKKLKDDFYVDLLANTPALDTHSVISNNGPDGMEMFAEINSLPRNPTSEKLNELTARREQLIQQDSPDEAAITQLNTEIRSLLLNCAT